MPAELFKVKLTRDNPAEKWGFAMTGGKDQLLVISEVCKLLLLLLLFALYSFLILLKKLITVNLLQSQRFVNSYCSRNCCYC